MRLQDPVTCLKGIGPKKAEALAKLGIMTLEDMMLFFPRDYEDRRNVTGISQLRDGVASRGADKQLHRRRADGRHMWSAPDRGTEAGSSC